MPDRFDLDASDIDRQVGERIRRRRILVGFTQDQLGEQLGISYQQIQKYETGANRVSAGRLYMIAQTLQTSVAWFFDGLGEAPDGQMDDDTSSRHVIELVRGFSRIREERHRTAVLALIRALSQEETEPAAADMLAGARHSGNGNGDGTGPYAGNGSGNGRNGRP